ncbi:hypothetical protein DITRI_Ditri02bG0097100 [Diplodiscus trichospermus]
MAGISLRRVLSMLMMSIVLVLAAVAQEEDFLGLDNADDINFLGLDNADAFLPLDVALPPQTFLPSETPSPSPSEAPYESPSESPTPSAPQTAPATTPTPPVVTPPSASIPLTPPPPQTPLLLPETPLPLSPPEGLTCLDKCYITCSKLIIPFLQKLCLKVCNLKCKLIQSELVYSCTSNCAQSSPAGLASDEEQMDRYVDSCYQKCKNHD